MNLFTLISCGAIQPDDPFLITIQNVDAEKALQIGMLLALSNKADATFQWVGLDCVTGAPVSEDGLFVVKYEDALRKVSATTG